jgi:hypothetical protein
VERIIQEEDLPLRARNIIYTDPKAQKFAEAIGKVCGTGKTVVEKAGIAIDGDKLVSIFKDPPSRPEDYDQIDGQAKRWSPEMDEVIRPLQMKAESVGVLMTPVLVVRGEVKLHGSVPSIEQIKSWLA